MLVHSFLADAQIADFAALALAGIEREFPNKPAHVMTGPDSVVSPRKLHPVFYGCFDWHSSVHGHWLLVRLLRLYPETGAAPRIRAALDRQFSEEALQTEARYFDVRENESFERAYGWAWLLRLAAELRIWDDSQARQWSAWLAPLETRVVELMRAYLPRLTYPIRTGVHPDTAFALAQMLDYSAAVEDGEFRRQLADYCRAKYLSDRGCCASFEPSGEDFFSPALNEADLMRRVLGLAEFSPWLERFLPGLGDPTSASASLLKPVEVSDVSDPKIVHLAGLNLSRAWTLTGVAGALSHNDPRQVALAEAIAAHTEAGLRYVLSGHYEGEHWLATFAVYLLTRIDCD